MNQQEEPSAGFFIFIIIFAIFMTVYFEHEKQNEIKKKREEENKKREEEKQKNANVIEKRRNKTFQKALIPTEKYYLKYKLPYWSQQFVQVERFSEIPMDLYFDDIDSYGTVLDDDAIFLLQNVHFSLRATSFVVCRKIIE